MIAISTNIQLQKITIEDQPKLTVLMEHIYPPVYKHLWENEDCNWYINHFYCLENLQKELDDVDADYYFVIYNSKPAGIIRIHYNKAFKDMPEQFSVQLHRIFLGSEAQGKGVAKQLFDWAEQQAKQKGKTAMWLKAMDTQQQALRFYEKQGYKKIDKLQLDFDLLHEHLRGMHVLWKSLNN